MHDQAYNFRHNFMSGKEWKDLLIISIGFGFIVSFRDWGAETFDFAAGIGNLIAGILLVFIAMLVHEAGHRFIAYQHGIAVESFIWKTGLFIALFLAFLTNGWVWFLAPGGIVLHQLKRQRLGKFRYGLNTKDIGKVALAGPVMNVILALGFKVLLTYTGIGLFEKAMNINLVLAVVTMLPLPCLSPSPGFIGDVNTRRWYHIKGPLNGGNVLFASRILYVFSFLGILVITLLLNRLADAGAALFWSLVIAFLLTLYFFINVSMED